MNIFQSDSHKLPRIVMSAFQILLRLLLLTNPNPEAIKKGGFQETQFLDLDGSGGLVLS
jgi:hypothetical protein